MATSGCTPGGRSQVGGTGGRAAPTARRRLRRTVPTPLPWSIETGSHCGCPSASPVDRSCAERRQGVRRVREPAVAPPLPPTVADDEVRRRVSDQAGRVAAARGVLPVPVQLTLSALVAPVPRPVHHDPHHDRPLDCRPLKAAGVPRSVPVAWDTMGDDHGKVDGGVRAVRGTGQASRPARSDPARDSVRFKAVDLARDRPRASAGLRTGWVSVHVPGRSAGTGLSVSQGSSARR